MGFGEISPFSINYFIMLWMSISFYIFGYLEIHIDMTKSPFSWAALTIKTNKYQD